MMSIESLPPSEENTPPVEPASYVAPTSHVLGPRKRIVAHEVKSAALNTLNPADLSQLDSQVTLHRRELPRPDPSLVDPTVQIGERHRRRGHNLAYRLTAVTALVAYITASLSIALLLTNDRVGGMVIALLAMVSAAASLNFSRSPLARRRRGHAVAAILLASVALVMNLSGDSLQESIGEVKTIIRRGQ